MYYRGHHIRFLHMIETLARPLRYFGERQAMVFDKQQAGISVNTQI